MDMQTWASAATMVATVIAAMAYMSNKMNRLADRIETTRSELGQRTENTHADLSQRIDSTRADLSQRLITTGEQSTSAQTTLRTELKADVGELRSAVTTLDERVYQLNSSVVAMLAREQARAEPH